MDIQHSRPSQQTQASSGNGNSGSRKQQKWFGIIKITSVVLLFSITVLLVALLIYTVTSSNKTNNTQASLVDTSKYQAVFLVNQQLPYFGKIAELNKDYMVLKDIYYLQINQSVQPGQENQPQDITLVKLGCELHGPQDQMVINSDQIFFWENLKDNEADSKVSTAIKQFQEKYPNGLECKDANN